MTWEIVLGLISLISVFGLVGGWTGKLYRAIAALESTVKMFKEMFEDFRSDAKKTHSHMMNKIESCESRISSIERKVDK